MLCGMKSTTPHSRSNTNVFIFLRAGELTGSSICFANETQILRRTMYKSVGYKVDERRRLQDGKGICQSWCNGIEHCQIVHSECGIAGATEPNVVAYIGDYSKCEKEMLKIDQALDLVGDAMEESCQELVQTRTFKCIEEK
jgi:hypothetical protein